MTKSKTREIVNNIVNGYCEEYESLCNKDKDYSSIFYMKFVDKIIGIFDLLTHDSSFTCGEHVTFLKECISKIYEIYNKYN